MSYFFIVNPRSGKKRNKKHLLEKISEIASRKKLVYEIEYTQRPGHAFEIAFEALNSGYKKIVAVGGDGTIREISSCLLGKDASLGIIPMGSGNGFARNISIPLDVEKAIETVFEGNERNVDVGLCNGEIFLCSCGFGADAIIAEKFNTQNHNRGLLPYFVASARVLLSYKPKLIRLKMKDGSFKDFFPLLAAVMNGKQYGGGAIVNPNGLIDDGSLEFVSINKMNFFSIAANLHSLFNGSINKKDFAFFLPVKNTEVFIGRNSMFHLDGEHFICESGTLNISVLNRALKVITF